MWIFLNNAMLSIVQHRDDSGKLMVRARRAGDIERVFPDAEVTETLRADYRFRAVVDRKVLADKLGLLANGIDYDNFKSSVDDVSRHDAYMDVWSAMLNEQRRRLRKGKRQ